MALDSFSLGGFRAGIHHLFLADSFSICACFGVTRNYTIMVSAVLLKVIKYFFELGIISGDFTCFQEL